MSLISNCRKVFHQELVLEVLSIDSTGVPTNADKDSALSKKLAISVASKLLAEVGIDRLPGQTSGNRFETAVMNFLSSSFLRLGDLRPGIWEVLKIGSRAKLTIAGFYQYEHLETLAKLSASHPDLAVALGSDYVIAPDVVIVRQPEDDIVLNRTTEIVDSEFAKLSPLRASNNQPPILHASISCKWTLRSDRAQNAKSEALNLVRNRKGKLPHIVAVTGEPLPARIASLALGTGDLDCVYHIALPELVEAIKDAGDETSLELIKTMIIGKRLKDISDLPLDLCI